MFKWISNFLVDLIQLRANLLGWVHWYRYIFRRIFRTRISCNLLCILFSLWLYFTFILFFCIGETDCNFSCPVFIGTTLNMLQCEFWKKNFEFFCTFNLFAIENFMGYVIGVYGKVSVDGKFILFEVSKVSEWINVW